MICTTVTFSSNIFLISSDRVYSHMPSLDQ